MRQLVQQHLCSDECVALLGVCRQLARAVVQHRTHGQESTTLHWTWRARQEDFPLRNTTAKPEVAVAARLLADWAPAELHVWLRGTAGPTDALRGFDDGEPVPPGTAVSLPAALPPLITRFTLTRMHVTPGTMDLLQRCQRLRALDVDDCTLESDPYVPSGEAYAHDPPRLRAHVEQVLRLTSRIRSARLRPLPLLRELR